MTFAGEELGLLGSSYYVNHPVLPLKNDVAMINMDMIGRVRDRKIYIGGVGTGNTFGACSSNWPPSTISTPISPKRPATDRATTPRSPPNRSRCCSSFPVSCRLSQAQRHLGQDQCSGRRAPAGSGGRRNRSPDRRLAAPAIRPGGRDAAVRRSRQSAFRQRRPAAATAPISAASPISPNYPMALGLPTSGPVRPPPKRG